jgi:hypothetical protein
MNVTDKLLGIVEEAIDKTSIGDIVIDRALLKQFSGTLKDIKDIKSIKSELDIEELRAKIALLKKQAESDKVEDTEIIVTYKDDTELWGK